jgi:hypothetical protein
MDKVHKHVSLDAKIIKAAPHPRGAPLDPKEYYMADPPGHIVGLLAWPGETHRVVYWLDTTGLEPTIQSEACETMSAADRKLQEHRHHFPAFTPGEVIAQMEKTLEKIRKLTPPKPELFQGMPYIGDLVWVIAPDKSIVQVKVTEIGEMSGSMSIIFGFYYKPNGEWFWTKEAAEVYAASIETSVRAKNVFLGDKS